MAHVFISYAHADGDFAASVIQQLRNANIAAWIDSEQLRAGKDWRTGIDQAIEDAFAILVIITSEAKLSEYVTYEWAYALGAKKTVIPLLLMPTELHPRLEVLQHIDFTDFQKRPWGKLIEQLQEIEAERSNDGIDSTNQDVTTNYESTVYLQRLVFALSDPNPATRKSAAISLGQTKDHKVIPDLLGILQDKKEYVREAAAQALGQIGKPSAVSGLLQVLEDKDYQVREAAAKALGQIGDASSIPGLAKSLNDSDKWVRAAARRALTAIGTPKAMEVISEWEKHET